MSHVDTADRTHQAGLDDELKEEVLGCDGVGRHHLEQIDKMLQEQGGLGATGVVLQCGEVGTRRVEVG